MEQSTPRLFQFVPVCSTLKILIPQGISSKAEQRNKKYLENFFENPEMNCENHNPTYNLRNVCSICST